MNENENENDARPRSENPLRRHMDRIFAERLTAISANMDRFRDAAENAIRETSKTQAQQSVLIERITALNDKFLEHDEREGQDRLRVIHTVEQIAKTLSTHGADIKANSEAIGTLKQWSWLLAGAIGAISSAGVAWIIQHLQVAMQK